MEYTSIQHIIKCEPAIKLLQRSNAALIISFLYRQFKQALRITIPETELAEKLEDYLEALGKQHPDTPYPRAASDYLKTWCDDDHQMLKRYHESGSDDALFELTPAAERVIGWLEDLTRGEFVGTESRFLRIFDLLEEIVMYSVEDPHTRLEQLEQQKEAIQHEMDFIQTTGVAPRYNATQIRERFIEANDTARRLLADFKEVEQNFREITQTVQKEQLKEGTRKGAVVQYVIDRDDTLKESEQGRSFYAFWRFLMSPSKQEQLQAMLSSVYNLPDIHDIKEHYHLLRRIKNHLIESGQRIVEINHHLAERLRRMLDEQHIAEVRRVLELITELKKLALELETLPEEDTFFILEGPPDVRLVMDQPLWSPSETPPLKSQEVQSADALIPTDVIGNLATQFHVNDLVLRQRIDTILAEQPQATLAEITTHYPVRQGLAEVIAYIAIAALGENHFINEEYPEQIMVADHTAPANGAPDGAEPAAASSTAARLTLPQIVFRR